MVGTLDVFKCIFAEKGVEEETIQRFVHQSKARVVRV